MWSELLAALGLLLVLEGLLPFLSPGGFRRALLNVAAAKDPVMRWVGFACMIGGLLILNPVK